MKRKKQSFLITDGTIEFVSLVSNGANRTPFKVIKSEEGGKGMSKKVVQRVIIPNSIGDDATAKILEGFRNDEVEDAKSYKSYIQVSLDMIKEDSIQLAKTEEGAYMVVGDLAEGKGKDLKDAVEVDDEKEELDWTTLDDIFSELYALEGIISGTLRQKATQNTEKAELIQKAVANFQTGLDIALSVIKYDVEDVPEPILPGTKSGETGLDAEAVKALIEEVTTPLTEALAGLKTDSEALADASKVLKTELATSAKAAVKADTENTEATKKLEETIESLTGTIDTLKEEIEVLQKQPKKKQSDDLDEHGNPRKVIKQHTDDYYGKL